MAVTLAQLGAALRISDGVNEPEEPYKTILQRHLDVAVELVELHAPKAPTPIKDEAAIRVSGYLYDTPTAARGDLYANAWANSGAASLLSHWIVRRAASVGRE